MQGLWYLSAIAWGDARRVVEGMWRGRPTGTSKQAVAEVFVLIDDIASAKRREWDAPTTAQWEKEELLTSSHFE